MMSNLNKEEFDSKLFVTGSRENIFRECLTDIADFSWGVAKADDVSGSGCCKVAIAQFPEKASVAAAFTSNAFCAAPVHIARERLACAPRYLLINSGCANAGLGERGLLDARAVCRQLADLAGVDEQSVLPFSTGLIGVPLPVQRMEPLIRQAFYQLAPSAWKEAAHAIMTTDQMSKGASLSFEADERRITLTAIAKGAGMIHPNMATMLAFIATDATLPAEQLQPILQAAIDHSFNRISVDGDTSTNDACVLVATNASPEPLSADACQSFAAALEAVCLDLSKQIVADGEGASCLIAIEVSGGASSEECLTVARAVAASPLVKTGFFGRHVNWGHALAAVGGSLPQTLDIASVSMALNDVNLARGGTGSVDFDPEHIATLIESGGLFEAGGKEVREARLSIDLGRGSCRETIWTADLSHEYVRINTRHS